MVNYNIKKKIINYNIKKNIKKISVKKSNIRKDIKKTLIKKFNVLIGASSGQEAPAGAQESEYKIYMKFSTKIKHKTFCTFLFLKIINLIEHTENPIVQDSENDTKLDAIETFFKLNNEFTISIKLNDPGTLIINIINIDNSNNILFNLANSNEADLEEILQLIKKYNNPYK